MKMIESKRHITNFYVSIAFVFLFCNAIGGFLINFSFNEQEKIKQGNKTYILSAMGVLFVVFAFYTIYQYFKNTPEIIIEKNKIFFNKETFKVDDIHFINLTCKVPFRYIINYPVEGFYIEFKNGKEKFIYNEMYSNIWEIKDYLKQVVVDKTEYKPIKRQEIEPNQVRNEQFAYYNNNQLLSFRGIMLFGLFVPITYGLLFVPKNISITMIIFWLLFSVFWYIFNGWLMNYYGLSRNHFTIKNFFLPSKRKVYKLDDIVEIVFESQGQRPNGLRVITKSYESKLYIGATLYDDTWRELKKDLRKKNITVRDECIDFEY